MTDLVERIRGACDGHPHAKIEWPHRILHEAADRIEALEAALREIEMKLVALNDCWALEGGPFDGGWISEVMALAPEQVK